MYCLVRTHLHPSLHSTVEWGEKIDRKKNVCVCVMWLREPIPVNSIWWPALIFTAVAAVFRFICFFSVVPLVFLLISRLLCPKSLYGITKKISMCVETHEHNAPFVLAFYFCCCCCCLGLKLMPANTRGSVNPQESSNFPRRKYFWSEFLYRNIDACWMLTELMCCLLFGIVFFAKSFELTARNVCVCVYLALSGKLGGSNLWNINIFGAEFTPSKKENHLKMNRNFRLFFHH